MHAAVVPAVRARWELKDVPVGDPGPNEVLIKIRASGLCYTDVHQTNGDLPGPFPRILGHEPVGDIVAVGTAVTTRRVGDRVGVPWVQATCGRCEWCLRGRTMFCANVVGTGGGAPGGHAEYMPARADATMLLPDGLAYEQAAPIFCAGYTVWSGFRWADPQPHERVAVVGIGGLGHLAVQYAKAAGFETIAVSHSPDKDELVRELGADAVVHVDERDPVEAVRDLTDGALADAVIVGPGSIEAMELGVRLAGRGASVVLFTASRPDDRLAVAPYDLYFREIRIVPSYSCGPNDTRDALALIRRGVVTADKVITHRFPLADLAAAYRTAADGGVALKTIVTFP